VIIRIVLHEILNKLVTTNALLLSRYITMIYHDDRLPHEPHFVILYFVV